MKGSREIIFTKEGYQRIQEKYALLQTERITAVEQLQKARDMGDLSENGFYKASKQKLASIDHQLALLKHQIRYGIIKESLSPDFIQIGSTITIEINGKEKILTVVGEHEANPAEGKISFKAPLGKGLLNKRLNEVAYIQTPRGISSFKIKKII